MTTSPSPLGMPPSTTKRMVMALTVVFCPTAPALLTVDKLSLPKIFAEYLAGHLCALVTASFKVRSNLSSFMLISKDQLFLEGVKGTIVQRGYWTLKASRAIFNTVGG